MNIDQYITFHFAFEIPGLATSLSSKLSQLMLDQQNWPVVFETMSPVVFPAVYTSKFFRFTQIIDNAQTKDIKSIFSNDLRSRKSLVHSLSIY